MSEATAPGAAGEFAAGTKPTDAAARRGSPVEQILHSLEVEPGDRVTCVHVFGDFYRCNWWTPGRDLADRGGLQGFGMLTYRVRKSRFIRATTNGAGQVLVQDATASPPE